MTQKLFLTAKFHHVSESIAPKLGNEQRENIVFITTPFKYRVFKESELDWHYKNLDAMKRLGYKYDFYDITDKSKEDIVRDLSKYKAMYVEGGSPFYFMQEANKKDFGNYIHKRLDEGMIYIAESAGSVCAGADIAANSRPGKSLSDYDLSDSSGFKLVNFSILPHWGQKEKTEDYFAYKIPQAYKDDNAYIPLTNYQYIEVDGDWWNIVDLPAQAGVKRK